MTYISRCEHGTPMAVCRKCFPDVSEHNDWSNYKYTHPVKEQYKFGVDWSKDGNAVTILKICEDGVAEVVFMDYQKVTHPVKELTREDRLKLIGTLKWAEDLLREAGHDEAVSDVQDCLMILRKAQEK